MKIDITTSNVNELIPAIETFSSFYEAMYGENKDIKEIVRKIETCSLLKGNSFFFGCPAGYININENGSDFDLSIAIKKEFVIEYASIVRNVTDEISPIATAIFGIIKMSKSAFSNIKKCLMEFAEKLTPKPEEARFDSFFPEMENPFNGKTLKLHIIYMNRGYASDTEIFSIEFLNNENIDNSDQFDDLYEIAMKKFYNPNFECRTKEKDLMR